MKIQELQETQGSNETGPDILEQFKEDVANLVKNGDQQEVLKG